MSDASTGPGRNPGNRTDKRGRGRAHQPTDASRRQVEALASFGVPRSDIAKVAGICLNTLAKHYGEMLDIAATKANSLVAQSLFNRAVKGDGAAATSAAIFWLRADPGYLYPACLKQFAQSLGLTVLMALPMLFQRASTLRSADVRRTDLIFAKRFSIGLRSGL